MLKAALALAFVLSGCDGGSDAPAPGAVADVVVSGTVTFDFVPVVAGPGPSGGLRHELTEARPARAVTVEFVSSGSVLARTSTGADGRYSLSLPANRNGFLRVRAQSVSTGVPRWDFRVADNTNDNALYTLDGGSFSTGTGNITRNLNAGSGWTGASYGNPRSAAPFAILDTLYEGAQYLLAADPTLALPPMAAYWSPENTPTDPPFDFEAGELPSSFYNPGLGMYLLGNAAVDTDEYDRHVILHEFAHYLESAFWRSDSIGGPHVFGDALDFRLAFSEGFGNAFSGLAIDDPIYRDAFVQGGVNVAGWFGLESDPEPPVQPGWFSERSIHELIYDLVDAGVDLNGADTLSLEFGVLFDAFMAKFETMSPLTSLFPLVTGIVELVPAAEPTIDLLLATQQIAPIVDDYGSNQQNAAGASHPSDVLPIYLDLPINGVVNVCSTDEFGNLTSGVANKLGTRRFLRFTPPAAGTANVTVTATDIPDGEHADPDFWAYAAGLVAGAAETPPDAVCENIGAPDWTPDDCRETGSFAVTAGREYILEVYEWTNAFPDLPPGFSPIGRTCFDVQVTL